MSTGNRTCLVHLSVDSIYRITAILNYETCIIASIAMSPIGRVIMLVKMYVEIFKTDVIVFIGIERQHVTSQRPVFSSIRVRMLILTISRSEIKCYTIYR